MNGWKLHRPKDFTDDENVSGGKENFDGFRGHFHDQAVLTNSGACKYGLSAVPQQDQDQTLPLCNVTIGMRGMKRVGSTWKTIESLFERKSRRRIPHMLHSIILTVHNKDYLIKSVIEQSITTQWVIMNSLLFWMVVLVKSVVSC